VEGAIQPTYFVGASRFYFGKAVFRLRAGLLSKQVFNQHVHLRLAIMVLYMQPHLVYTAAQHLDVNIGWLTFIIEIVPAAFFAKVRTSGSDAGQFTSLGWVLGEIETAICAIKRVEPV
jgi:hypothetical protein